MLKLEWCGKEECLLEHTTPTDKQFIINKDKSVNFDTTNNIIIEGDNLDVLKLLQSEYQKKIKMIYIDPPYNTGRKGLYRDKYWKSKECKHSTWLNMMYPRLKLARELLRDDGVIFVSIDDHEQANLKLLMDEVFGEGNLVSIMPRKTKPSVTTKSKAELQNLHDYILVYWKNKKQSSFYLKKIGIKKYPLEDAKGKFYIIPLQDNGVHGTKTARPNLYYPIYQNTNGELSLNITEGSKILLPKKHKNDDGRWMWSKEKFQKDIKDLYVKDNTVFIKHYYNENEDQNKYQIEKAWLEQFPNRLGTATLSDLDLNTLFSYSKPIELIQFLITLSIHDDDIILDFFAGSGTTGHAVMQLNMEDKKQAIEKGENPELVGNRKYIMVQLPEEIKEGTEAYKAGYKKISDITIERIKRAGTKILEENPDIQLDVGFKVFDLRKAYNQEKNILRY